MIVQGAFWKLPELLLQTRQPRSEQTIATQFAMAALLELNARNIDQPMHRVVTERPYAEAGGPNGRRADVFLDLSGLYDARLGHHAYGMKARNWVEAKYFRGAGAAAGVQPTTQHAGSVLLDLVRLALFVREDPAAPGEVGRFGLVVCDDRPERYLALGAQSAGGAGRAWLRDLLEGGVHAVEVDLAAESQTLRRPFGGLREARVGLRVETLTLQPAFETEGTPYWAQLLRIIDFDVTVDGETLSYRDGAPAGWSEADGERQMRLAAALAESGGASE